MPAQSVEERRPDHCLEQSAKVVPLGKASGSNSPTHTQKDLSSQSKEADSLLRIFVVIDAQSVACAAFRLQGPGSWKLKDLHAAWPLQSGNMHFLLNSPSNSSSSAVPDRLISASQPLEALLVAGGGTFKCDFCAVKMM